MRGIAVLNGKAVERAPIGVVIEAVAWEWRALRVGGFYAKFLSLFGIVGNNGFAETALTVFLRRT